MTPGPAVCFRLRRRSWLCLTGSLDATPPRPRVHLGLVVPLHQGGRRGDESGDRRLCAGRARRPRARLRAARPPASPLAERARCGATSSSRQCSPTSSRSRCSPGAKSGSSSALTAVLNASTPLFTAIIAARVPEGQVAPDPGRRVARRLRRRLVAAGFGGGDLAHSSIYGSLAGRTRGCVVRHRIRLHAQAPHLDRTDRRGRGTARDGHRIVVAVRDRHVDLERRRISIRIVLVDRAARRVRNGRSRTSSTTASSPTSARTRASLVTYVIPVVAVTVGVVVLDEPFEWSLVYGRCLDRRRRSRSVSIRRRERLAAVRCGPAAAARRSFALVALPLGRRELLVGRQLRVRQGAHRADRPEPRSCDRRPARSPHYTTDPPTSGPHTPAAMPGGVLTQPLSDRRRSARSKPASCSSSTATSTAPDVPTLAQPRRRQGRRRAEPDLPDRVVATAWLNKQTCSAVDVPELRGFIRNHQGRGPGTDG